MKTWINADIITIDIQDTANGGTVNRSYDQVWFDENSAAHVTFNCVS